MRGREVVAVVCLLVTGCLGCTDVEVPEPEVSYRLEFIEAYGASGVGDTTPDEAVFGIVPALAADSTGSLFVLDRDRQRVVSLSPTGDQTGSAGRRGEGPGEYELPVDVTMRPDDRVSVLDYDLGRVTVLDPRSLEVRGILSGLRGGDMYHEYVGDTVWVAGPLRGGASAPLLIGYAPDGQEVASGPVNAPEDVDFEGVYGLDTNAARLVASTGRPGVWWEYRRNTWTRVGQPLYPEAPPRGERRDERPGLISSIPSPVGVGGIALLGDSIVIQRYRHWPGIQDGADPAQVTRTYYLAFFDIGGSLLDTIVVPESEWLGCLETAESTELLICRSEPYPQVVRYRIHRN